MNYRNYKHRYFTSRRKRFAHRWADDLEASVAVRLIAVGCLNLEHVRSMYMPVFAIGPGKSGSSGYEVMRNARRADAHKRLLDNGVVYYPIDYVPLSKRQRKILDAWLPPRL